MKTEPTFMMLFRYAPDPNASLTPDQLNEMQQSWGAFIGGLAMQEKLVSTYQLGFEGTVLSPDHTTSDKILDESGQTVSGNMVLKAHSLEEVVSISKNCPILTMGGSVEIRSIVPMEN